MKESYGISEEERLTTRQLCGILGSTPQTLAYWRRYRKGPPFIRIVGRVYYPKVAFEEWLKTNMHNL